MRKCSALLTVITVFLFQFSSPADSQAPDISIQCHLQDVSFESEVVTGSMQIYVSNFSGQSLENLLLEMAESSQGSVHGEVRHAFHLEDGATHAFLADFVLSSEAVLNQEPILWRVLLGGSGQDQMLVHSPACGEI